MHILETSNLDTPTGSTRAWPVSATRMNRPWRPTLAVSWMGSARDTQTARVSRPAFATSSAARQALRHYPPLRLIMVSATGAAAMADLPEYRREHWATGSTAARMIPFITGLAKIEGSAQLLARLS